MARVTVWDSIKRPPWRTIVPGILVLLAVPLGYTLWSPGKDVRDGRHDLGRNGIWLQHGWLGDDEWFRRNNKTERLPEFRSRKRIEELAMLLHQHHITDVFPHLCPASQDGRIAAVDAEQTERFLDTAQGIRILPWIGGVQAMSAYLREPKWRKAFVDSAVALLRAHPRLAGVHVNIEPCSSGDSDFLMLLDELRAAQPKGKILSVAAYPPPTRWHPSPEVHWEQPYFREVAKRSDQMAVMMYDTGLKKPKLYRWLMASWTREVLDWSENASVLLGLPTYRDEGVGYHHPDVENLENALLGIHAGLTAFRKLPAHYQGIAVYCEWETDESEWRDLDRRFLKRVPEK